MRTDTCLYCDRKVPVNMSCNCPKSVTITTYCSECVDLNARIAELEGVLSAARAILTCISDVEDGCALVSCGDHAADLREALAKFEESDRTDASAGDCPTCGGTGEVKGVLFEYRGMELCPDCICGNCHKPMQAVRPGKWQCGCEEE